MTMSQRTEALKLLSALNPARARQIVVGPSVQRRNDMYIQNIAGNTIMQTTPKNDSCCPSKGGGLPSGPNTPVIPDICKGILFSNARYDTTSNIVSYQRSALAQENNWIVSVPGVPTALTNPIGQNLQSIDGLIFWFPAIQAVQIAGFVSITISGFTYDIGSGASIEDFTVTRQVIPGVSNAPMIYGELFRNGNNDSVRLRLQSGSTIADAGGVPVNVPGQDVTVTITGWPATAAPVQVFAFNSRTTWIRPYTELFDREL